VDHFDHPSAIHKSVPRGQRLPQSPSLCQYTMRQTHRLHKFFDQNPANGWPAAFRHQHTSPLELNPAAWGPPRDYTHPGVQI
jgi:hypothetical protein